VDEQELVGAIRAMQQIVWSDRAIRQRVQNRGINVIPAKFYASVPSLAEIESSFEYAEPTPPYLDCGVFDGPAMRDWLAGLVEPARDFTPPKSGNEETCAEGFFWNNSQFSFSDAMSYYAMLRQLKPARVVEIGAGFSSLVALAALRDNRRGRLTCIEPYPRPFLHNRDLLLMQRRAQEVTIAEMNDLLADGDVLFIDSTHTVKTGSDCLHIYLRLLPRIARRIFVHVHDVFLPFGLPQKWLLDKQIHWTEQYLLLAWLIGNPRTRVLTAAAITPSRIPICSTVSCMGAMRLVDRVSGLSSTAASSDKLAVPRPLS